jgi:hypothetical protein
MQRVFLGLTMALAVVFIPSMIKCRDPRAKLLGFLSMTSVLATAYCLVFIPNKKPNHAAQDQAISTASSRRRVLHRWLPYLNGALAVLIAVNGYGWRGRKGVHDGFWVICLLPTGKKVSKTLRKIPANIGSHIRDKFDCQKAWGGDQFYRTRGPEV